MTSFTKATNSTKPRILLVTMQPARMPGIGGEVRTFYFTKSATEIGDVTLVSLGGPGGHIPASKVLTDDCAAVIQTPDMPAKDTERSGDSPSRLSSLANTTLAFVAPWRNKWHNFLNLCVQHCLPESNVKQHKPLRKRMLSFLLQTELGLLSRFFSVPPLTVFAYSQSFERIRTELQSVVERNKFDLLWIEHTLTFQFVEHLLSLASLRNVPIVLNAQNIEFEVCDRVADVAASKSERRFWKNQARLVRQLEQRAYNKADMAIQCSQKDVDLAKKSFRHQRQIVVGNGVDTDYFRPAKNRTQASEPTVVFTGGFGYHPNQEAVTFFVEEILPLIRTEILDCRFVFAGSQADNMNHLIPENCPFIEGHANPEDIRPFFDQAWIYVVPIRAGGGTRLKVLEAMAMERAIVSTSLGAEGIPCENGRHLMLADTPQKFAAAVVQLIRDQPGRAKLEREASDWVREHYSWEQLCEGAREEIRELV